MSTQVLSLSERLQHTSALFDRCRSIRNKQTAQQRHLQQELTKPAGRRATVRLHVVHAPGRLHGAQEAVNGPVGEQRQQMQAQLGVDAQDLLDTHEQVCEWDLCCSMTVSNQVARVERTMLEVSALHQMFATQVMHQSQQIEEVYMQVRGSDLVLTCT